MLKIIPRRWAFALLVFCAVYPLVTGLVYLTAPLTPDWAIWQRNLLTTPLMVVAMVWVIIPAIQKRLH